jgi:uncharacterized surface protein with fasciclin (FAS1) repeats
MRRTAAASTMAIMIKQLTTETTRTPFRKMAIVACVAILSACSSSAKESKESKESTAETTTETIVTGADESTAVAPDTALDTIPVPASTDDVFTTIEATNKYPTFVKLVNSAGLADALRTGGPFTVAVPTEAAFAALPQAALAKLESDAAELSRVLRYHVVPGLVSPDPAASGPVASLEGSPLNVVFTATNATLNDATILTSARVTANGAYVEIDAVLTPPAK